MDLITYIAKMCMYAQSHVADPEAWDHSRGNLENLFQCTSFSVACFLAQNTVHGSYGVDWDIVIDGLCNMPAKSEDWWLGVINQLVSTFGGLK